MCDMAEEDACVIEDGDVAMEEETGDGNANGDLLEPQSLNWVDGLEESDDDDIVELRPGRPIEATPLPKVAKTEEQTAEPSPRPARLLAIPMRPGARNVSISALLQANSDGTATEQVELMPAAMLADLSPEAQAAIDHVRRQIKDHGESRDSRS